jgi:hypothetical protein
MEKGLMAKDEWANLGLNFGKQDTDTAATSVDASTTSATKT